ncbi:MAG TPA: hypothetical protein VNJ01_10550 [Bacteriovoracaceae bacterium]|nr:hypothetical protein [Bacteriovoracaceae bacterium]
MSVKKLSSLSLLALFLLGGAALTMTLPEPEVLIQSLESKTQQGHPVFNRIKFKGSSRADQWFMWQSHDGAKAPAPGWDQIKITVDKSTEPFLVSYQQFKKGREVELKASCFTCHANGPRAIRPDYASKEVAYRFSDKLWISWMNLKMKSYGKVKIKDESYSLKGTERRVPLRYFSKLDSAPLKVKTCLQCHNEDRFFSRGELQRQHSGTIKHLVATKQMPPWPFKLSKKEQLEIDKFVKGF